MKVVSPTRRDRARPQPAGHRRAADLVLAAGHPVTLVRDAILESQRLAARGGVPYHARLCDLYYHSSDHLYDSAYCPGDRVLVLLGSGNEVRPWLAGP